MTDRPPPEPVPPRVLHVPPFRGEEFDALVRQLDVADAVEGVLSRPACEVSASMLAESLSRSRERPRRVLRRIATRLESGG